MKITPEDVRKIYDLFNETLTRPSEYEKRDLGLLEVLIKIYDRGHADGRQEEWQRQADADMRRISHEESEGAYSDGECPYDFSHTREWCGYRSCRES